MHSINQWKFARSPNYDASVDKEFPYSEVPYIGGYKLVKIPKNGLIELVDYWGEGLIHAEEGVSGFADSYNVNHEYQLVSNGPDRDSKIPNRIPVISYTNCNTSGYIKDDSVKVVTLMGAPINKSCANDIARMVNQATGKVIIYGFDDNALDVKNLKEALSKKGILLCFGYNLPSSFKKPTLFDSYKVFINVEEMTDELYNSVTGGLYDRAVSIAKTLEGDGNGSLVVDIVNKMLKVSIKNVVGFAAKLAANDGTTIVNNFFPEAFKLLVNKMGLTIMHKGKLAKIIFDENNTVIGGLKSSDSYYWEAIPVWNDNIILFKFKNSKNGMFLSLSETADEGGNRKVIGTLSDDKKSAKWVLEPLKVDDYLIFFIINEEFKQGLTLIEEGDKNSVVGHNGPVYGNNDSFGWFISPA